MPRSWYDGTTWAANASLISTRSMSPMLIPARARRLLGRLDRAEAHDLGREPETPVETIRASGVSPSSAAFVSLMITTAAAPSLSGQQLPAVTAPSGRKTGFRPASRLEVTPARGPSSGADHGAVGRGRPG